MSIRITVFDQAGPSGPGLADPLRCCAYFEIAACLHDLSGPALDVLDGDRPDVIVVDGELLSETPAAACRLAEIAPAIEVVDSPCGLCPLRARSPGADTRPATLADHPASCPIANPSDASRLWSAVSRHSDRSVLRDAIRQTVAGIRFVDPGILVRRHAPPLTDRELAIAPLIHRAMGNKEIATKLGVSIQTIKDHVSTMLVRLGVETRGEIGILYERGDPRATGLCSPR